MRHMTELAYLGGCYLCSGFPSILGGLRETRCVCVGVFVWVGVCVWGEVCVWGWVCVCMCVRV